MRRKGGEMTGLGVRGALSRAGGVRRRDAAHSTWTLQANRSGPEPTAPRGYAPERGCRRAWRRRTSYTPGAARLETRWQATWAPLPLPAEEKRLKVKCPPRACPPRQVPPGSRARRRPGPRARRDASRMNGSPWTPLPRPGRLPRPRLTFPGGGGGGSGGGRGRRSGAGRAGAVRFLSAPWHPDGEGGESGAAGKTLKVTL